MPLATAQTCRLAGSKNSTVAARIAAVRCGLQPDKLSKGSQSDRIPFDLPRRRHIAAGQLRSIDRMLVELRNILSSFSRADRLAIQL